MSLGFAIAFYYAITSFARVWYFRRVLFGIGGVFIIGIGSLLMEAS